MIPPVPPIISLHLGGNYHLLLVFFLTIPPVLPVLHQFVSFQITLTPFPMITMILQHMMMLYTFPSPMTIMITPIMIVSMIMPTMMMPLMPILLMTLTMLILMTINIPTLPNLFDCHLLSLVSLLISLHSVVYMSRFVSLPVWPTTQHGGGVL